MPLIMPAQGDAAAAAEAARKRLEAAETASGHDSLETATALKRLAARLREAGRPDEAAVHMERLVRLLEGHPTNTPGRLAINRAELATMLMECRRDVDALGPAREALAEARVDFAGHPGRVTSFQFLLAGILTPLGQLEEAETHLEAALRVPVDELPQGKTSRAKFQAALARVSWALGKVGRARSLLTEALGTLDAQLDPTGTIRHTTLSTLGSMELSLGRTSDALHAFEQVLPLIEQAAHQRPTDLIMARRNIAVVLGSRGQREESTKVLKECLRTDLGKKDPLRVQIFLDLAINARALGNFALSMEHATEALVIEQARSIPHGGRLALGFFMRGLAHFAQGEHAAAVEDFELSMGHALATLGRGQHQCVRTQQAQARALMCLGRQEEARAILDAALEAARDLVARWGQALSEAERHGIADTYSGIFDLWLTMAIGERGQGGSLARGRTRSAPAISDELLRWKGQVLRGLDSEREWLRSSGDAHTKALGRRLTKLLGELTPLRCLTEIAPDEHVRQLVREREDLERELARRTGASNTRFVSTTEIQATLKPEEALIDFLVWKRWDLRPVSGKPPEERLLALVLRQNKAPGVIDLGPLAPILQATLAHLRIVTRWVKEDPLAPALAARVGDALSALLWKPLRPAIAGATRAFIIPDGVLAWLPFETLPGHGPGRFLLEELEIIYLPTAQARATHRPPSTAKSALLVGDVDFGGAKTLGPSRGRTDTSAALELSRLPGTRTEIEGLAKSLARWPEFDRVVQIVGSDATEARVRREIKGHRLVHLATHGVFLGPPEGRGSFGGAFDSAFDALTPNIRSGLAFAGVNDSGSGEGDRDDGFLTSAEAGWLELEDCELLTISSCFSGAGVPLRGQGLLGLRRAFYLAGARTTVTALWRVRDDAASELMGRFYDGLLEHGLPRSQAFRKARLDALQGHRKRTGQPLVGLWGAFVLEGEWERSVR